MMELGVKLHPPKHPLERNRDMVEACDVLWAFPRNQSKGTWYTIRHARKLNKPILIVYEDGRIEKENH